MHTLGRYWVIYTFSLRDNCQQTFYHSEFCLNSVTSCALRQARAHLQYAAHKARGRNCTNCSRPWTSFESAGGRNCPNCFAVTPPSCCRNRCFQYAQCGENQSDFRSWSGQCAAGGRARHCSSRSM